MFKAFLCTTLLVSLLSTVEMSLRLDSVTFQRSDIDSLSLLIEEVEGEDGYGELEWYLKFIRQRKTILALIAALVVTVGSIVWIWIRFSRIRKEKTKLEEVVMPEADVEKRVDSISSLSKREKEVVLLTMKGKYNKEIASELNISTKTVEGHKRSIFQKLGISNSIELIRYIDNLRM